MDRENYVHYKFYTISFAKQKVTKRGDGKHLERRCRAKVSFINRPIRADLSDQRARMQNSLSCTSAVNDLPPVSAVMHT